MRAAIVMSIFFIAAFSYPADAKVRFVRPDGSGPIPTIQAGIDACLPGDTVVALTGVYTGPGNRDIDFHGKAVVVMAGSSYDTTKADSTIIDCEHLYRAFYLHSNEDSSSVIQGFVIQRSNAWDYPVWSGGGILCWESSPTIRDNIIRWCRAYAGGGIICINSSPRIIGNNIRSCYVCGSGGGIRCEGGSPYIAGNKIYDNDCTYGMGAGLTCNGCTSVRIIGNEIYWNYGHCNCAPPGADEAARPESRIANSPAYVDPGGVYISDSDAIIRNNKIFRNFGEIVSFGSSLAILDNQISGGFTAAAVHCCGCSAIIEGNAISSPGCQQGGSIYLCGSKTSRIINNIIGPGDSDFGFGEGYGIYYCGDSSTVIENNTIYDHSGAGIRCHSSIRIANNVIHSNGWCDRFESGGIYCEASPLIERNTIVNNSSRYLYGETAGIYCAPGSSPMIRSNIIAHNQSGHNECSGVGIYSGSPSITVECCDVYGNEGGNYMGIEDQTGLNGNISADPIFCDAENHDYSIHELSPCAPANHPKGTECGFIGALGIGCDFIETGPVTAPALPLTLFQNHPNPFNPSTTIAYHLPERARIRLEIYDISGRRIAALVDCEQERGAHAAVWDGKDNRGAEVASGVYFSRLTAGKESLSKKLILLR